MRRLPAICGAAGANYGSSLLRHITRKVGDDWYVLSCNIDADPLAGVVFQMPPDAPQSGTVEVLFENLVLTLCGGLAGWVLSWFIFSALRHNTIFQMLFLDIPMQSAEFGMNLKMFITPTLFLVVFLCCAVLNLMVALIPARRSLKNPIVESLNQER